MSIHKEVIEHFTDLLFQNGRLTINPKTYLYEREDEFKENFKGRRSHPEKLIEELMEHERRIFPWLVWFNREVPAHWTAWNNIVRDITIAKDLTKIINDDQDPNKRKVIQLSEVLIDAAVSHPHWAVRLAIGENQFLDPEQLAYVLSAPQPGRKYSGIYLHQDFGPNGRSIILGAEKIKIHWQQSSETNIADRFVPEYLTTSDPN